MTFGDKYVEMRSVLIFVLFQLAAIHLSFSQSPIDHWESLVNAENSWHYFVGTYEPPSNWKNPDFDTTAWNKGPGGFGYADNDDRTIISTTLSVYLRINFTVYDLAQIEEIVLLADYDDAFVAYLNGIEIARGGITGSPPAYNQPANADHEAGLYRNIYPEEYRIKKSALSDYLVTGGNVLAVQVHNKSISSSDLSSNFYLAAGINISTVQYQPVPNWFRPPLNYETSNLPIIKIDTQGQTIPDEPKIPATMGIIDNGPDSLNHINDPFNGYDGHIGIEIRGSSSKMFPKKQYAVELWTADGRDTSASILGLPPEEDWILNGPYSDKSLLRNVLAYKLSADQGWYAPRTRFCELYLNDNYRGVYFLTEKIKRDKYRVNISKLTPSDNSGDQLTGGYIVKLDKYDGATEGLGWASPYPTIVGGKAVYIHFQYHYPKEDEITTQQGNYIQNYVTAFEKALRSPEYRDPNKGYRKYINVESFIDFAIVNEITRNVDGYRLSTFLYKDRDSKDSKIYIGPVWDFNLAFGNADYCEGGNTSGWAWDFNEICPGDYWFIPFWWERFLRDPDFVIQFQNRWLELRSGPFSNDAIMNYIDSVVQVLDEPQQRNFNRWPVLSEYIWPNNYVGGTYANEISYLKNWINSRLAWLDASIAGLDVITAIDSDLEKNNAISIYPNPGNGSINIKFKDTPASDIRVSIINSHGKKVLEHQFDARNELTITGSSALTPGVYILQITGQSSILHMEKIIIY